MSTSSCFIAIYTEKGRIYSHWACSKAHPVFGLEGRIQAVRFQDFFKDRP